MEELQHKAITAVYDVYDASSDAEELMERVTEEQPLKFITELGIMPLAQLEENLKQIASGDEFEFCIETKDTFGEYMEEKVVEVPKSIFNGPDGLFDQVHVRIGVIVPLQNEQGERFMAQIKAIGEDKVTIDLNHPLAGKTLKFKGKMLDNHDASEDEVMALLNQLNQAHKCHGGCHGGCHEGGECNGNCGHCGEEGNEGGCGHCDGSCKK